MATQTRELTCINCPLGCQLVVTMEDDKVVLVEGNTCKRGETYGRKEVTNPTRIVTTTVPVDGSDVEPMVSVKTATDVPKARIFDVMAALKNVRVTAPVHVGDVVLPDVCGTGVDIVATKEA